MAIEIVNWLNEKCLHWKNKIYSCFLWYNILVSHFNFISFKLIVIIKKHNKQFASPLQIKEEENGKLQQFSVIVLRKCNFIINIYRNLNTNWLPFIKQTNPHIYIIYVLYLVRNSFVRRASSKRCSYLSNISEPPDNPDYQ